MSFSVDVIRESVARFAPDPKAKQAMAMGAVFGLRGLSQDHISLKTKHGAKASAFASLLDSLFATPLMERLPNADRSMTYRVSLPPEQCEPVLEALGFHPPFDKLHLPHGFQAFGEHGAAAMLAGVFLVCGSVNAPGADRHLELVLDDVDRAGQLQARLSKMGLAFKRRTKQNIEDKPLTVLYATKSETVEDFLTWIGAGKAALELMEEKVLKEVRGRINRQTNCETANMTRTLDAARKQNEEIARLVQDTAFFDLPLQLQQVGLLRLANPDLSLAELGKRMDPPLSRSGVNHRLEKLLAIARKIFDQPNDMP